MALHCKDIGIWICICQWLCVCRIYMTCVFVPWMRSRSRWRRLWHMRLYHCMSSDETSNTDQNSVAHTHNNKSWQQILCVCTSLPVHKLWQFWWQNKFWKGLRILRPFSRLSIKGEYVSFLFHILTKAIYWISTFLLSYDGKYIW